MQLEICCYSVDDAIIAYQAGADRIEFCAGRSDGGLTPSYGQLKLLAEQKLPIPIHPIVRPRGGDFCYSHSEIVGIKYDLALINELGFAGAVFGCLNPNGQLDIPLMQQLLAIAPNLNITFHRAFDVCNNPLLVAKQLADLGVKRILTSGQKRSAPLGIELLEQLVNANDTPIIMAGAGVRAENIEQLIAIGLQEFHASATKMVPAIMKYRNEDVKMGDPNQDEFVRYQADNEQIKAMREIIDNYDR